MASNKFFTILIVPEKTQQVRRIVVPTYLVRGAAVAFGLIVIIAFIMILDYTNVINQISENRQLKVENRQLKQSVQVFKNKMVSMENTFDRVKTFVTKLRIITNIEESPISPTTMPMSAPVSAPFSAPAPSKPDDRQSSDTASEADLADAEKEVSAQNPNGQNGITPVLDPRTEFEMKRNKRQTLLAALNTSTSEIATLTDSDNSAYVTSEFQRMDSAYDEVNAFASAVEQDVQHLLDRLGEKKALLASTPTRMPTLGYISSDYGVRISPYDGRRKMHEGIDIAGHFGADIIAPANGTVSYAGEKAGYGKLVVINHGNGIETVFAHNSRFFVRTGDRVKRGQRIAAVGNTGHSTGPHCHYEVRASGLPVDPCWYILDQPGACRQR